MKKILIIEDDASHRRMLKELLSKSGYQVMIAGDGIEGTEIFNENPCDLVITDIFMPEQEGLETITNLKEIAPDIKVIAISGGSMKSKYIAKDILLVAEELGADKVLPKPINIPQLLSAIIELVGP